MNEHLARAIFYAVLTITSLASLFFIAYLGVIGVFFLFLSLGNFATYLAQKKKESIEAAAQNIERNIIYGKMGMHVLDGDEDESYGLYIDINHKPVFIDIREDELMGEREKWAMTLFENTKTINENFNGFVAENPGLQGETIYCIGLHSKNPAYGEIIWDSGGVDKNFPAVALNEFDFVFVKETPWWKPVW